jgi:hypothetical protein
MGEVYVDDGECDVTGGADYKERGNHYYEALGNLQFQTKYS